jgi:hypothetical protein
MHRIRKGGVTEASGCCLLIDQDVGGVEVAFVLGWRRLRHVAVVAKSEVLLALPGCVAASLRTCDGAHLRR